MKATADPTKNDENIPAATEVTPLLGGAESNVGLSQGNGDIHTNGTDKQPLQDPSLDNTTQNDEEEEVERPMPVLQILLLCFASLAEPVAYFGIFPFISEMLFRVGQLDESDVGFWTGFIESLFSLVQMLLMIIYGRAADSYGRKPILVFSLAGISVFTALFGLSGSLWQMVLARCACGLFAGSAVTIRTMVSENCTRESQARAFSWYMFTRNLGIFIGPLIGGPLANPAEQFPGTFGRIQFFHDRPYALPTFVAGAVCLIATLLCLFFLNETLPGAKTEDGIPKAQTPKLSTWEILKAPGVGIVLLIFGHTMLLALGYTAVSPVFLFTHVDKGGLGFSDPQIAGFLAVAGASQAGYMLLAFPWLQRRFGTGNLLRACAIVWPIMMASFPVMNELLRHGLVPLFWTLLGVGLIGGSGVSMAFACVQLCINDISPSSNVLGTVNALSLTVNSAVRAFAPIAFTSLYAVGVKLQWADGHLIWFIIVPIALALNGVLFYLPEQAECRPKKKALPAEEQVDDA